MHSEGQEADTLSSNPDQSLNNRETVGNLTLTSLQTSFLICKTEMIIIPTSKGCWENLMS